jgi:hypothetical protein
MLMRLGVLKEGGKIGDAYGNRTRVGFFASYLKLNKCKNNEVALSRVGQALSRIVQN